MLGAWGWKILARIFFLCCSLAPAQEGGLLAAGPNANVRFTPNKVTMPYAVVRAHSSEEALTQFHNVASNL